MTRFSAMWSEKLGKAILANAPALFHATFNPRDARDIQKAVNQGIDAYLQACYLPDRGDDYHHDSDGHLICAISRESLPVLIRRLLDAPEENASELASALCAEIDIELI